MSKSILDYEEAKQRLQQLQNDQAVLGELVTKLRRFSDDVESKVQSFDEHNQRAQALREEAQAKASEVQGLLEDLQSRGDKTLKQFEQGMGAGLMFLDKAKSKVEEDCESAIQQVSAAHKTLEERLKEQRQSWVHQQDARFDDFAKQHHADMEKVANAYERHNVVFGNVKTRAESLEETVEQQGRATQQALDDMREDVQRQLADERNETAVKVEATREEIANLIEVSSSAITRHVEDSLQSSAREVSKVQLELRTFKKEAGRHTMLLGIAVIFSLGLEFATIYAIMGTKDVGAGNDGDSPSANVDKGLNGTDEDLHPPTSPPVSGDRNNSEPRVWTDSTGRTTPAFFVGFDGENVQLKKADGKVYTISINQLDERDQVFVRQHAPRQQAVPSVK